MFERDKNHTAILIWSCGNESYAGEDILAMSDFFHRNDPGRLVHYEGGVPLQGLRPNQRHGEPDVRKAR